MSKTEFTSQYSKWCQKHGYNRSESKATALYELALNQIATLPPTEQTKDLIVQAISQLNFVSVSLAELRRQVQQLAASLPECPVVLAVSGVGETLGPQLIAEIGDVRRFSHKGALVAFAGVDAPPFQSGVFESASRSISKRGSPALRKTLFQIVKSILKNSPSDDAVYQFLDRKTCGRETLLRYYVYMVAGCNKFLHIYYARVKEYLVSLEVAS